MHDSVCRDTVHWSCSHLHSNKSLIYSQETERALFIVFSFTTNDFKEYSNLISKLDIGYEVPTDLKILNNYVGYEKYLGMIYKGKRALVSTENKV